MAIQEIRLSGHKRTKARVRPGHGIVPKELAAPEHGSGAEVEVFRGSGMPDSSTTVSFDGNPIIMEARVGLIFYGPAWLDPSLSPSASQIEAAISKILDSPYLSGLIVYECTDGFLGSDWNLIVKNNPPNPFST